MNANTTTILHSRITPSPVGDLTLVASEAGLCAVLWPVEREGRVTLDYEQVESPVTAATLDATERQLAEYFTGDRTAFDLELDLRGTEFQVEVWNALTRIAHGETTSYAELANGTGRPGAARAVGAAVGRNPISIVVPCHRVVGSNGSLTGFAGGLDAKRFLLDLEAGTPQLVG